MWQRDSVKQYGLKPDLHAEFYSKYFTGSPDYDVLVTKKEAWAVPGTATGKELEYWELVNT